MPLTDHLDELRRRVVRTVIIIIIAFGVFYNQGELMQEILLSPLKSALGTDGKVVFLGLLDKVLAQFQLAFWCSLILSSPLWFRDLHQR